MDHEAITDLQPASSAAAPIRARGAVQREEDVRRSPGLCAICAQATQALDRLSFATRRGLPTRIPFEFCAACNFVFAGDVSSASYRDYYASVRNDGEHVIAGSHESLERLQADRLSEVLGPAFDGAVLDFGCGRGRLLRQLADRFPRAALYGHDVGDHLDDAAGTRFLASLDDFAGRFDLIVVSHVVEHLVDFSTLERLARRLRPGGSLYVEVPDPFEYHRCARREFMYYFDRLHVNHFSRRSLRRLLERCGLDVRHEGTHRFTYRDGHYPAAYCLASPTESGSRRLLPVDEARLDGVYHVYRALEAQRASQVRAELRRSAGPSGYLVYGAGDNFRRALWPDGPLDGLPLLAVMDRKADEMRDEAGLRFMRPEAALAQFPDAPVIVTVSEGGECIAAMLTLDRPDRVVRFV